MMLKRLLMAAATAFLAINIWTGAPLLALWVGSRIVGKQALSMTAVFVVVIVLAALVYGMTIALTRLSAAYDELIGRPPRTPRFAWLRSMSTQDDEIAYGPRVGVSALERIVMASVYVAVIGFLVWFFVLAGSPLPHV
jgi:CBS domain containing-hemolysin-like protein